MIFRHFFVFIFRAARLGTAARGIGDIHVAAELGTVPPLRHFLRVNPGSVHEKDEFYCRGLKKLGWFSCFPEVEGGFGPDSFNILKFGAERNEFVGFLLYSWT